MEKAKEDEVSWSQLADQRHRETKELEAVVGELSALAAKAAVTGRMKTKAKTEEEEAAVAVVKPSALS